MFLPAPDRRTIVNEQPTACSLKPTAYCLKLMAYRLQPTVKDFSALFTKKMHTFPHAFSFAMNLKIYSLVLSR